jgi:hypothetical protein
MSVNHRSYNIDYVKYGYTKKAGSQESGTLSILLGGSRKYNDAWIPEGTTHIKDDCFYGYYVSTYAMTIPNSVKTIGARAFYACARYNLTIPSTVESVGDSAFFASGESNGNLDIGARHLGERALANGIIYNLTIRNTVDTIGKHCFIGAYIESLVLEEGITNLSEYAFSGVMSISSFQLPKTLKVIGDYCFAVQGGLGATNTIITVPKSVTYLGKCAFGTVHGTLEFEEGLNYTLTANAIAPSSHIRILKLPSTITLSSGCFNEVSAGTLYINRPKNSINISDTGLLYSNIIWTG